MDAAIGTTGVSTAPVRPAAGGGATLAPPLLILLATLLGLTLVKHGTDYIADVEPDLIFAWCAAIGGITVLLAPARYAALPTFARRCLWASSAFLALYFLIEPFAIPYAALPADHPAVLFHSHARWIGLAVALAGLWRPGFVFAGAMLLWMMRELQPALTGFYFSTLDIRNVAEVLAFWAVGFSLTGIAARLPRWQRALDLDRAALERAALILFAAGVGAHFANYFWSGLAKLWLDGGLLSWLLDNRLYDGIPGALEKGTLPLAFAPGAVAVMDTILRWVSIPVNLIAFAVQIFAIAAPARRRWLALSVLSFDLFHLVVWFTLGLLFWKWIALNMIILIALSGIREHQWTGAIRMTAIVFVIAGMAIFRTATLAWYDSPGFASPYFVAEMEDGTRYRVPNAFFLSSSYQVSQGQIWWPGGTGHFNASIWGSVLHHDDLVAGRECRVPDRAEPAEPRFGPPALVGRFVRTHHQAMLPRLDGDGVLAYYRVPHHHVPSPFVADPFYAVDKRRIARYYYVMDSVCLSLDHGRLRRDVRERTAVPVYDVRTGWIPA